MSLAQFLEASEDTLQGIISSVALPSEPASMTSKPALFSSFTGAADKAVNLVGCKSPHHQLPGRVVSMSDACGGNEACSART